MLRVVKWYFKGEALQIFVTASDTSERLLWSEFYSSMLFEYLFYYQVALLAVNVSTYSSDFCQL